MTCPPRVRPALSALLAMIVITAARPATAQAPAVAPPAQSSTQQQSAEARRPGEYHHDGVYVRLGAGVALVRDKVKMRRDGINGFEQSGTVTGLGQANELAVGGALAPGLILAGGFFLNAAYGVSSDFGDVDTLTDDGYAVVTFGPLVDFYPDPGGGLHFELGFGLGATSGVVPASMDDPGGATGYGIVLGVGHEWWIAKQWALGALLRLQHVEAEDNIVYLLGPDFDAEHSANALSLMFTATFN